MYKNTVLNVQLTTYSMPHHRKQQNGESGVTNFRLSMCKITAHVTKILKGHIQD
jgi:hypothetical protein